MKNTLEQIKPLVARDSDCSIQPKGCSNVGIATHKGVSLYYFSPPLSNVPIEAEGRTIYCLSSSRNGDIKKKKAEKNKRKELKDGTIRIYV